MLDHPYAPSSNVYFLCKRRRRRLPLTHLLSFGFPSFKPLDCDAPRLWINARYDRGMNSAWKIVEEKKKHSKTFRNNITALISRFEFKMSKVGAFYAIGRPCLPVCFPFIPFLLLFWHFLPILYSSRARASNWLTAMQLLNSLHLCDLVQLSQQQA